MKTLSKQFKTYWPALLALYVPVILIFTIIQFFSPISMDKLTKDWASAVKVPFYWGMVSNIGILLWWATAAVCIFAFFLLKKRASKAKAFFLYAGIFSAVLAIDDFFFFHDIIFPQKLGIKEETIFLVYFGVFAVFIAKFKDLIRTSSSRIFLYLAVIFFVLGLAVDIVTHNSFTKHFTFATHHFFEDGNKLLGIISWLTYFSTTAYRQVIDTAFRSLRPFDLEKIYFEVAGRRS